jgi:hypothetical protein
MKKYLLISLVFASVLTLSVSKLQAITGGGAAGGGTGTIGGSTGAVDNALITANGVRGETVQSATCTAVAMAITCTGVAFASLGTPVVGTWTYCTDCVKVYAAINQAAAVCAGSGTGAFARRVNSGTAVWICD